MKYNYNYDVKMRYTDNPYIDLLVYYTKFMGINCIVKNEREALKYETLESRQESNRLIAYKQGVHLSEPFFEDSYEEKNNYYRMLNGQPPLPSSEEEESYVKKYGSSTLDPLTGHVKVLLEYAYIPMGQYQHMVPEDYFLNLSERFFHELNSVELKLVKQCGIFDIIKDTYKGFDYEYIYHMDEMKIDPYTARTAENFSLLFCPPIPFPEIEEKFKRTFERNRLFTITTIYSEAFTFGSMHYDNFIQILIIVQTMIDLISEVQEYIINKDVFDSRTIRYLFESYGIAYYKEIDVKYQLRIIKNVNRLLKFKSTNMNISDIIEIFDNADIDVFTYYLMKTKRVSKDSMKFYTYEDVNPKYSINGTYYIADSKPTNNRYPLSNVSLKSGDKEFYNKTTSSVINSIVEYYGYDIIKDVIPYETISSKIKGYFAEVSYNNKIYFNQYYYIALKNGLLEVMTDQEIFRYKGESENSIIPVDTIIKILDKAFPYTTPYHGWIDRADAINNIPSDKKEVYLDMPVTIRDNMPVYNASAIYQIVTEDMVGTEKFVDNYNLCFLRVPISEPNAHAYIEDVTSRRNYDHITLNDPFWDGVSKADILTEEEKLRYHNEKRDEILNKEFTIERTKYLSVDAAIDITKMSYQLSYFMNILYDKHIDEELLELEVNPKLSSNKVRLNDLLAFATALNYLYNGVEPDMIASDMEKNMTINGFNFDTDWVDIYNELNNRIRIYNNQAQPMNQGHLVEFTDEQIRQIEQDRVIASPNAGAFLSGRYDPCTCTYKDRDMYGYSVIWENLKNNKVIDIFNSYCCDYIWDGWNGYSYPSYLDEPLREGFIDESIFGIHTKVDEVTGEVKKGYDENGYLCHYIDLTWDTPYKPENNSHGLFMNTDILNTMTNSEYSDLDRFNKLKEIYYTNTNLYDHLQYMMRTAESKRMYDIYNTLFESFMETTLCHEFYNIKDTNGNTIYEDEKGSLYHYVVMEEKYETYNGYKVYYDNNNNRYIYNSNKQAYVYKTNSIPVIVEAGEVITDAQGSPIPNSTGLTPKYSQVGAYVSLDGTKQVGVVYDEDSKKYIPENDTIKPKIAKSYYEFLQHRNMDLYEHLLDIDTSYKTNDEKKMAIMTLCSYVVDALEQYFDSKEWKYIYNLIPSHNIQFIQQCILKIVIFFKSWKTQMLDQTVSYIIDDPNGNYVHLLDDLYLKSIYNMVEKVRPLDFKESLINTIKNDDIDIQEKINIIIRYPIIIDMVLYEKVRANDIKRSVIYTTYKEKIGFEEQVIMKHKFHIQALLTKNRKEVFLTKSKDIFKPVFDE